MICCRHVVDTRVSGFFMYLSRYVQIRVTCVRVYVLICFQFATFFLFSAEVSVRIRKTRKSHVTPKVLVQRLPELSMK